MCLLRQRHPKRDRAGEPHAAEHVEILRAMAGGNEIEIGVAEAGDDASSCSSRCAAASRRVSAARLSVFADALSLFTARSRFRVLRAR